MIGYFLITFDLTHLSHWFKQDNLVPYWYKNTKSKYIPFIVTNDMKCIKHNITSRLGFVKELQGVYEKLAINWIIKILKWNQIILK